MLIAAGTLRLPGSTQVGVRFDDEISYVLEARLWERCLTLATDGDAVRAAWSGDKSAVQARMNSLGIDFTDRYDKPSEGFTVLGAFTMLLVGDDPSSLVVLSAVCGTLSVLVLWAVGLLWVDRPVACGAALLLAVSPYHVLYCRTALPYATMGLFVLVGVLCWSMGYARRWTWRRAYLLAGISLGLALLCHFSSAIVIVVLALVDWSLRRSTAPVVTRDTSPATQPRLSCLWLAIGFSIPILSLEFAYRSARFVASITDAYLPLGRTYLEGWWHLIRVVVDLGVQTTGGGLVQWRTPLIYGGYFVHWHGYITLAFLMIGLAVAVRRRGGVRFAAALPMVVLLLLLFQRYSVARVLAPSLPLMYLCVAVGVASTLRWCRVPEWAKCGGAIVVAVLIVVPGVSKSVSLMSERSDLRQAVMFIQDHATGRAIVPIDTSTRSKYAVYNDGHLAHIDRRYLHRQGSPREVLDDLRRRGVEWVVADPQFWHYYDRDNPLAMACFTWWRSFYDELADQAELAAEFPHVSDYRWEFLAEGPGLECLPEMKARGDGPIRIYRIRKPIVTEVASGG